MHNADHVVCGDFDQDFNKKVYNNNGAYRNFLKPRLQFNLNTLCNNKKYKKNEHHNWRFFWRF